MADGTLDFLDHYLGDAPGGLAWLQVRADVPGVARLDQERKGRWGHPARHQQ